MNLIMGCQLHPYQHEDLPRLTQFAGACYALADCPDIHVGDALHLITNLLRLENRSRYVFLVESPAGELVALILISPPRRSGYTVIIHPDHRTAELETALLNWSEQTTWAIMGQTGESITSEAADCDTLRRDLLKRAGYVESPEPVLFHTARALDVPIPESVLPEGFVMRSAAGVHEAEQIAAVHSSAFRSNWTGELYRAMMQHPGFHIDRELVVVAPDGCFAAFLVYWVDPVSGTGLFEPVGCHEDFRRRGLTRALLYEGLRRLQAHGLHTALVNHHADNPASTALYRSVGFVPRHAIYEYRKPMTAS